MYVRVIIVIGLPCSELQTLQLPSFRRRNPFCSWRPTHRILQMKTSMPSRPHLRRDLVPMGYNGDEWWIIVGWWWLMVKTGEWLLMVNGSYGIFVRPRLFPASLECELFEWKNDSLPWSPVFNMFFIWLCLKMGYTPNEIAIFHRDNDHQPLGFSGYTTFSDKPIWFF